MEMQETEDPVVAIFKMGEEHHMRALVDEGHLYLQTVDYFRTLDEGSRRADPFEASSYCLHLDGWTFDIEDAIKNWQRLGTLVGGAPVSNSALASANLYLPPR